MNLAHTYGISTGKDKSMTDVEIAKELIAYKAPVTPGDDNNQGNTGDNSQEPADGDTTTPDKVGNQGVLANAEGNASASAGIMAAVATALTAAGVGVVAFRNARRSSKKA